MTLRRKKEPMTISKIQKRTDIHQMFESISRYIVVVQDSREIIWKIVSIAHPRLSKPSIL